MVLGHEGLEISGGDMIRTASGGSPLHKQAVGQTAKHSQDPHGIATLDSGAIVIVGDVQALMEPAFNAPALAVEEQPTAGIQPLHRSTGDQSHFFVFASGGLA